jgi:hypothetical protein
MNLIMVLFIKVSGQRKDSDMVKVYKSGKMAASMRAIGKTTWLMAAVG